MGRIALLEVVGLGVPKPYRDGGLPFVAGRAVRVCGGRRVPGARAVGGLDPLIDERLMRSGVTAAAPVRLRGVDVDRSERLVRGDVGVLNVSEPRPVAALALHVVVGRIRHHTVSGGLADAVAQLRDRVTRVAGRRRMTGGLQVHPGASVLRRAPRRLHAGVAVAARRLLGAHREIAEKAGRRVRRRIERRPIDVGNRLLGTPAKDQHRQDHCGTQPHECVPLFYGLH